MVSRSLINVDGTLLVLPSGEASAEQSNNLLGKRDSLLLLKLSSKAAAFLTNRNIWRSLKLDSISMAPF